jgi:hypothetical protein
MQQARILIVSFTVPENRLGGAMLLYRHFALRSSFEVGLVTNNPAKPPEGIFYRKISPPHWLLRALRTRFFRWFQDYLQVVRPHFFDPRLLKAAREFQPDLIFNVAETWLSFQALKLARKINVPFACYFMDWSHYASQCHEWAHPIMDRMYRRLYRESDLALCISDGMREELGSHPNAHVVYPIPGEASRTSLGHRSCLENSDQKRSKFQFLFAGSLGHWYGRQVKKVLEALEDEPDFSLKVYGQNHDWPEDFVIRQQNSGAFGGFRPFEEIQPEFEFADAFLLVMGFDPKDELIERTNFKTKLVDYFAYEKPILIWGPEYCSAVRAAREFNAAYCVTDPSPASVLNAMKELSGSVELRDSLVKGVRLAKANKYNAEKIHGILKDCLETLVLK